MNLDLADRLCLVALQPRRLCAACDRHVATRWSCRDGGKSAVCPNCACTNCQPLFEMCQWSQELTTPWHTVMPSDQTFIIGAVAVPVQDFLPVGAVLRLGAGEKYSWSHPVDDAVARQRRVADQTANHECHLVDVDLIVPARQEFMGACFFDPADAETMPWALRQQHSGLRVHVFGAYMRDVA